MIRVTMNQPENSVLGIEIDGNITAHDYEDVLIPITEDKLEEHNKISLLVDVNHVDEVKLAAFWEDTKFGIEHWNDFDRIAMVVDDDMIGLKTEINIPGFPGDLKIFNRSERDEALAWIKAE